MPTNPYTSQSISGYNATPPADDGSEVASNQLEWDKHKTKLGDPLKTLAEAINTAMVAAGAKLVNTDANEDNAIAGSLAFTAVNATVTDGIIKPFTSNILLDTESAAASDDLDHIATSTATNGPRDGAVLFLAPLATDHVVTLKDRATATGAMHLSLGTDLALDEPEDVVLLHKRGEDWYQIGDRIVIPEETARRGFIDGLILANTSTDTANDIDIGPGEATLSATDGTRRLFDFPSTVVKQVDTSWASGSPAGGLPSTVSYTATTVYHVFALGSVALGVEYGLDTSVSATALLATATGYSYFRRVGAILTGTATTVLQFTQDGDDFVLSDPPLDVNTATQNGTAALWPLSVPSGIKVQAAMNVYSQDAGNFQLYLSSPDATDEAPSLATGPLLSFVGAEDAAGAALVAGGRIVLRTDTSAQIRARTTSTATLDAFRIATLGWTDPRGRNATA